MIRDDGSVEHHTHTILPDHEVWVPYPGRGGNRGLHTRGEAPPLQNLCEILVYTIVTAHAWCMRSRTSLQDVCESLVAPAGVASYRFIGAVTCGPGFGIREIALQSDSVYETVPGHQSVPRYHPLVHEARPKAA